jgi:FtsP/CotA-like multicopper oxidase with cupredoxin domain
MYVIGTDQGYLDAPAKIDPNGQANNVLVIMPGERYEVIVDFAGFAPGTVAAREPGQDALPGRITRNKQHHHPHHGVPDQNLHQQQMHP